MELGNKKINSKDAKAITEELLKPQEMTEEEREIIIKTLKNIEKMLIL